MKSMIHYTLLTTALLLSSMSFTAVASESINPFHAHLCEAPDYNEKMLRQGSEGVVKLRFNIDVSGKTKDIQVESSSGKRELDQASISALKNCEFPAGTKAREITFNWKIL